MRLLLAAICVAGLGRQPVQAADLEIRITGLERLQGLVHFGLYNDPDEFPGGTSLAGDDIAADRDTLIFRVRDLTPGDYAVAVFHDRNANGEHDISIFGIEDFGFSQNARAFFGPPAFDDASFHIDDSDIVVVIDLGN